MKFLVERLKKHSDFEDIVDDKGISTARIKLMLGPVKDFKRAYQKVEEDYKESA